MGLALLNVMYFKFIPMVISSQILCPCRPLISVGKVQVWGKVVGQLLPTFFVFSPVSSGGELGRGKEDKGPPQLPNNINMWDTGQPLDVFLEASVWRGNGLRVLFEWF